MIERASLSNMIARVGALIDLEVTSETTPNSDQVTQWLVDGVVRMIGILPESMVLPFTETADVAIASGFEQSVTALSIVRPLSVRVHAWSGLPLDPVTYMPVDLVEPSEFEMARFLRFSKTEPAGTSIHPTRQPTVTFEADADGLHLRQTMSVVNEMLYRVRYVAHPADPGDWPDAQASPPLVWEEALADYAAAQAKLQDEEAGQGQLMAQFWEKKISEMAASGSYSSSGNTGGTT